MDQNDVFIGPDTTAGIELPQSPLTRKRTLAGEISRPAADSEAGYPAEEVPNHPEAAADPSGFPAAVLAHSSGASSAVEAVSFRLAADPPEAACPATVGCCPAGAHLWAAVPAAAASVRSSAASSAVFGHPAIASLAVAALVGLAAKAVLGAELDRRGRGFAVRSD